MNIKVTNKKAPILWIIPYSTGELDKKGIIKKKFVAELKLGTTVEDSSLINVLKLPTPWYVCGPRSQKTVPKTVFFGYISININFYVKILLIKEKKDEIFYKNGTFHFSPRIDTYRDNRPRNEYAAVLKAV